MKEVCNESGKSLLHTAIDRGHFKVAELLINHGADLDKQDNDKNTLLHLAAKLDSQDEELVNLLIEKGGREQLKKQNNNKDTPLHIALRNRHVKTVELLLDHQPPMSITNEKGDTPLHLAAQSGDLTCAKMILDKSEHLVFEENRDKHLPLHKAMKGKCNLFYSISL